MTNSTSSASQPEELCLVCQDISTGYHYGVPSCNGCYLEVSDVLVDTAAFRNAYKLEWIGMAPQHTYTELTYVTQSDYHYWHERDWFVMIEWAKSIPAYQQLPLLDKACRIQSKEISNARSVVETYA
ncbi:zinc finger, C4 type, partial [Teladorsagia circumcincta]